jgi:two-component system sensor histidine kinase HydH
MNKGRKKLRFDIALWVTISSIAVLAAISAIMVMAHFQRQEQQAQELFVEKGTTLIKSFEAGLHEAVNKENRVFHMQKLLMATAQQPDIDYLVVTDDRGSIIADSDPSMISQEYGLDLDTVRIARSREIKWRQTANPQGADTFEVYRGLFPLYSANLDKPDEFKERREYFVVYVGFNMDKIEKAAAEDIRNTIIMTLVLLLVGSLAIVSLFLVQTYRLTRTSLSRMKIFSETLIKNLPIGLLAVDEGGIIISCNKKAQEILKMFCPNVLGMRAEEILPANLNAMLTELSEKGGLLERDIDVIAPAGDNLKWEAVVADIVDEDVSSGKILLMRDITQIRELEKEVAKSRHLNSIASLAAGVAHEIRNPLSSIKGLAIYLKERMQADSEDKEAADVIVAEVERLNRVITQLIEFARPLELKKEKSRLSDLIGHTIKLIDAEAQKNNITTRLDVNRDEQYVDVDTDKIKQVFLNIFLNAMAAMKNGGRLEIALERGKEDVQVVVSDNGIGIKETDLPRIYDPYFTSKPAGTGLGLAVVQKIMEAHRGKIIVESVDGKGTKVILFFPV